MSSPQIYRNVLSLVVLLSVIHTAQTQNIFCFFLDIFTDIFDCSIFGDFFCAILVVIANIFQCSVGFGAHLLQDPYRNEKWVKVLEHLK